MPKTIKIKIPVAVDHLGRWYAYGWRTSTDQGPINHDQLLEVTDSDSIGPSEALYWITCELPMPQKEEFAATVTPANQ